MIDGLIDGYHLHDSIYLLLSDSAQRHNVSTVEAGVRRSFVLELWGGPPNARNRHS